MATQSREQLKLFCESINFPELFDLFWENGFRDLETLSTVSKEDLQEIGVTKLGTVRSVLMGLQKHKYSTAATATHHNAHHSSTSAVTSNQDEKEEEIAPTLPIRRVILFKHGIAYVEREGKVQNSQEVKMYFKSSEMNDVLKSLTVADLNGGVISSISYAANRSVLDQLEDTNLTLPGNSSLTGLLNQLIGSKVKVFIKGGEVMVGSIIGTELFAAKSQNMNGTYNPLHISAITGGVPALLQGYQGNVPHLNLLLPGSSIKTVNVLEVEDIELQDEFLRSELGHLLQVLINSKKKDSKQLSVFATGDGLRTINISYIVAAPLWKASYRILLPKPEEKKGKTLLQAWALIDNTMDEDWQSCKVALAAGLPISFIHDLYKPRYRSRPMVNIQEEEALAPPVLEATLSRSAPLPPMLGAPPPPMPSMMSAPPPPGFSAMGCPPPPPPPMNPFAPPAPPSLSSSESRAAARESSNPTQVKTVEAGDLFHYEIRHAVTVKRNGAALLPIFAGNIEAKRVSIYNRDIRKQNPMSAVIFKNTTGFTFDSGPATILEDEKYVGETMLDMMRSDDEKILPYSVELGISVDVETASFNEVTHHIRFSNGVRTEENYHVIVTTYSLVNNGKESELYIEHRFNKGYDLFETPEHDEKTENFLRFKIQVAGNKKTTFTVKERRVSTSSFRFDYETVETLTSWCLKLKVGEQDQKKLFGLIQLRDQQQNVTSKLRDVRNRISDILRNQQRICANLKTLSPKLVDEKTKSTRAHYIQDLDTSETELNANRQEVTKLEEEAAVIKSKYEQALSNITFTIVIKQ